MTDWRPIIGADRTPIQQGLATDPIDYEHYRMYGMMLGVILEVYPSDSENNRTAHQSETRRGFYHEAKVLLVNTNAASNLIVDHVVICPSFHAGLDDYYEHIPRGSSHRVDGERLPQGGANVDPYDLDGDWCVVGFMGGSLDQPFVVTWWPHPRNVFDAATSGNGNADRSRNPKALEQHNRYFRRVNGVEHIITSAGDIYLSTNYANSSLQFAPDQTPTRGRWTRSENSETGGSILVEIKPSQTLELAWDAQIDGAGISRGNDPELPQTNPPPSSRGNASSQEREEMYIRIDREKFLVNAPDEFKVTSGGRVRIICDDTTTISASNLLELDSKEVTVKGTNSVSINSDLLVELISQSIMTLTATGALTISGDGGVTIGGSTVALGAAASGASPSGPGTISSSTTGITLGTGGTDAIIKGTTLNTSWAALRAVLFAIPAAADVTAPTASALANANKAAILGMIDALASALSASTTTV